MKWKTKSMHALWQTNIYVKIYLGRNEKKKKEDIHVLEGSNDRI